MAVLKGGLLPAELINFNESATVLIDLTNSSTVLIFVKKCASFDGFCDL